MIYDFIINLKEIAEHRMGHDERKGMIKYILFECMNQDASNETMREILDDMMQGEQEFDNREKIVNAYRTLIKEFK